MPATSVLLTNSPTLSLTASQAGTILGTGAYLAPEQARGKPAAQREFISGLAVSPDETEIAFSDAGDIWILPVDFSAATPRATGPPLVMA